MRRAVAIAVVAALVLAGLGAGLFALTAGDGDAGGGSRGGGDREVVPAPEPEAGSQTPPAPALARFYSQQVDWELCGDLDCATLEVPVDYRRPRGETVQLALNRRPAERQDALIGPLVVNPGGPGAPGTDYAEQAGGRFGQAVLDRFDVVGMDPRGTGDSAPVDCLTDAELDDFLAADPVPDDAADVERLVDGQDAFFAGCAERTGPLLGHVTTAETARDLDVLRAALGQTELDYLGASYGTQLGATYAELFPERVGRFVLDGAVDVSLSAREGSLVQARGFETALRAYVENCLDVADDCFLGSDVEQGLATIRNLLDALDDEPLPTASGRELTYGLAYLGIVAPLYDRDNWVLLSQALRSALGGDGTVLLLLSDAYSSRVGDTYSSNLLEANLVINCLDDPSAATPEQAAADVAAFEEASPTLGEIFAWGRLGCDGITVTSTEPPLDIRGEGAAPILVTGTTRDPATPYEGAVALAEQLASGVLLTRDGDGHTAYGMGNECADAVIDAYLVDGVVPDDGVRC